MLILSAHKLYIMLLGMDCTGISPEVQGAKGTPAKTGCCKQIADVAKLSADYHLVDAVL